MSASTPETERLFWSPEQIQDYQLPLLQETLTRAARTSYYATRLAGVHLQALSDLARLPLTSKEDVRAASPFGLLAVPPEELYQYHESYGTTGPPTSSWMTRQDFLNYAAEINQTAVAFGPGDCVLVRFPFAISVPAHIVTQAAHERGACTVPVSSRSQVSPYPRVISLLQKLKATVLACLPTEAIWLAETARLRGHNPARDFPHLRALCVAGELLSDARRARISALWNAPVYNMYGCTEAGNMAADCEAGRLHLSWDHFLMEVLDESTNQPVPPGELGMAVVTTLTRQAMPLLRYQLGDYLRLRTEPNCPCGRRAPVVEHFGRDLNCFRFHGRRYSLRDLEDRLLRAPVESLGNFWLVEIREADVHFRVEAEQPDPVLYRQLEQQVRDELELPLVIEPAVPGTLLDRERFRHVEPVGKPRVIVSLAQADTPPPTLDDVL